MFEPDDLLFALSQARVRFVVIGGVAVGVHGFVRATEDLDIVPDPDLENLARLARRPRARPPGSTRARGLAAGTQRMSTGALYAETCAPSAIFTSARYTPRWRMRTVRAKLEVVDVPDFTTVPPAFTVRLPGTSS
jgi:hypothetical protein